MSKLFIMITFNVCFITYTYANLKQDIIDRREQIKKWAPVCQSGPHKGQYSESYKECKQGDLVIFTGLGCLAATLANDTETINDRCSDVRLSQGIDGRWWRGPTRVDNWDLDMNAFSRDQAIGVLAYFTARGTSFNEDKGDREAVQTSAKNWIHWMDEIGKGQMCLRASSNLCTILSSEPYVVLDRMNVFPDPESDDFKESRTFRHLFNLQHIFWTLPAEAALTPKGYQLHLKASTVLIRRSLAKINKISREEKEILDTTNHILYKKDSKNLYFEFLHKQKVTKDFVKRVLNKCPQNLDTQKRYFDWQWQRDTADKSWRFTNGHDCIFMLNLMLSKLQNNLSN